MRKKIAQKISCARRIISRSSMSDAVGRRHLRGGLDLRGHVPGWRGFSSRCGSLPGRTFDRHRFPVSAAACLTIALLGTCVSHAQGQQRVPHFRRTPAVSPYVTLYGNNNGGSNVYLGLVRPIQNQAQFRQNQMSRDAAFQQQLNRDRTTLPLRVMELQQSLQMRPATGFGQASTAASFMNFSHYYGQPISSLRPRMGGGGR